MFKKLKYYIFKFKFDTLEVLQRKLNGNMESISQR
jgi:hypothetical protein